jgi:hypothetical protein
LPCVKPGHISMPLLLCNILKPHVNANDAGN